MESRFQFSIENYHPYFFVVCAYEYARSLFLFIFYFQIKIIILIFEKIIHFHSIKNNFRVVYFLQLYLLLFYNNTLIPRIITHGIKKIQLDFSQNLKLLQRYCFINQIVVIVKYLIKGIPALIIILKPEKNTVEFFLAHGL